jgi:peptide/nickel transport system ATP-binding protein
VTATPLLAVQDLSITYAGSDYPAVKNVSFVVNQGEKLALVGESGCGKSTLGRSILQLLPPQTQCQGAIAFEGKNILTMDGRAWRRFRGEVVSLVFQDPMTRLNPLMTIGDHCLETLQAHQPELSRPVAKQRALECLERVKIPASRWNQYAHEFSGGMRQRVAIALALLLKPKLILADEPTTALDVTVAAEILAELTRLCAEDNVGLLLISHDLAMVGEHCDRLAVMNGGEIVETGVASDILRHPHHVYTQTLLAAALHPVQTPVDFPAALPEQPLLKLQNVQQYFSLEGNLIQSLFQRQRQWIKAVDGIDLDIFPGETVGLVGESGCGKSTLSRTILQLLPPTAGQVMFDGEDLTQLSAHQMRVKRRQLQMIFQDPNACLNPMMTVGQSIADPLIVHGLGTRKEIKNQVMAMLERVELTPAADYVDRFPRQLSGGQQQRVAIARALITNPKFVICDEPVSMLDARVQSQVLTLMQELKRAFKLTYLFITHDLWVARAFCDRIAVMYQGKIVELGETESLFTHPQHPYTQTLLAAAPTLLVSAASP